MLKNAIFSIVVFVISTAVALCAAEAFLRVKNSSMKNYDIEMWRYAKELKVASPDSRLGHTHVKDSEATLQSVNIRTNNWGLRGGPVAAAAPPRRILFLGGSITLGWGVPENQTVPARVEQMLRGRGENVEVLNGGVGNYNAERYVERFFVELKELRPTDLVVEYFLRDAENLDASVGNIILRNSELAVTMWIAANRLLNNEGDQSLIEHYKNVYREDQSGYQRMLSSLKKLADYAQAKKIRLYMVMMPDVHNLSNYPFAFIHERMRHVAEMNGFAFVDLLPAFMGLSPQAVWAMPGDPHPNAYGHQLMADAIVPLLSTETR